MKIMLTSYSIAHRILEHVEEIATRVANRARWARWRLSGGPFKVRLLCNDRCVDEVSFATYDEAKAFADHFMNTDRGTHKHITVISSPN